MQCKYVCTAIGADRVDDKSNSTVDALQVEENLREQLSDRLHFRNFFFLLKYHLIFKGISHSCACSGSEMLSFQIFDPEKVCQYQCQCTTSVMLSIVGKYQNL